MVGRGSLKRERYWRGVIEEQESSGLSVSAFCRERKVAPASFFSWRRKLADCHREQAGEQVTAAAKFVPLELPSPPSAAWSCCEVVLPDGCRIIVPARFDAVSLREILSALREQPC